jgi:phosphate transport system substrate-binding protein
VFKNSTHLLRSVLMRIPSRLLGFIALIALLLSATPLFAQEDVPITVVGSAASAPLFEALVTTSGTSATPTVSATGTRSGIEQFCQAQADIVLATRTLLVDEEAACTTSGVTFLELLFANYAGAVIVNPSVDFTECLVGAELDAIFTPTAAGQLNNWRQLNVENPDRAMEIIVPANNTVLYSLFDDVISGDGLRSDATIQSDDAQSIAVVASNPNAIALVSYGAAANAGDGVKVLQLGSFDSTSCVLPSSDAIEDGLYGVSQETYLYANSASLSKAGMTELLAYVTGAEAAATFSAQGFLTASETSATLNASVVSGAQAGRQFSREVTEFSIDPSVAGTVNFGGDGAGFDFVQGVTSTFQQGFQGVTSNLNFEGRVAGERRLCNGELDIIATSAPISAETQANCTANNITLNTYPLGAQGMVLVANAQDTYLTCLTTAQIGTIWGISSLPTAWNAVDASFPETAMTLIAPPDGGPAMDLMMSNVGGTSAATRTDAVENRDTLYRAASVAVVPGSLTYMMWSEYQRVVSNEQTNIMTVGVDSGAGCVQPSAESIVDGNYAFSRDVSLVVNQTALVRPEVQSMLWFIWQDASFTQFEQQDLLGLAFEQLPDIRDGLQADFEAAAVAAMPTPTPEPSATPAS